FPIQDFKSQLLAQCKNLISTLTHKLAEKLFQFVLIKVRAMDTHFRHVSVRQFMHNCLIRPTVRSIIYFAFMDFCNSYAIVAMFPGIPGSIKYDSYPRLAHY